MSCRRCALIVLFLLAACTGSDAPEAGGRFELRGESGRLMSSEALASFCADDSSLTIIALTSSASGGMAARLRWPLDTGAASSLRLQRRLGAIGTATLAWRQLGDSVGRAQVADSGVAELHGDAGLSGSADAWVAAGDTTAMRLSVRLSGIPVVRRCPEAPR